MAGRVSNSGAADGAQATFPPVCGNGLNLLTVFEEA
jgi:hypothetical protein